MSTWGLSSTVPLADFEEDPEDLIYRYFGTNWSVTNPTHIDKAHLFQTTTPANMVNRADPGNRPVWLWVQHGTLLSSRTLAGSSLGRKGLIEHRHIFDIYIMATRLIQGLTFPELGKMSREIERLVYQYPLQGIPGIQHFESFDMQPITEATALGPQWLTYAGTYVVRCNAVAIYQKVSTI